MAQAKELIERRFGAFARRDVDGNFDFREAVVVLKDLSPAQKPMDAAVRPDHAKLNVVRLGLLESATLLERDALPVGGVNRL